MEALEGEARAAAARAEDGKFLTMEKIEEQFNEQELSPEEKLDNFRNEIIGIKDGEMKKKEEWEARGQKGETYNPHFDIINPELLSGAEMGIYEKFKSGGLDNKKFGVLRGDALSRFSEDDVETNPEHKSAHAFLMYLSNIIHAQELRRQMDEFKRKK